MRARTTLVGVLATAVLAFGCATPTPQDLQAADEARVQAEQQLTSFARALRERDADSLVPLLAPHLRPPDVRMLQRKLLVGSSLAFYEDYLPDVAEPLADVSWREWQRGEVRVEIPYAEPFGEESEDEFTLVCGEGGWHILDFELKTPQRGDLVNLPQDIRQLLGGEAAKLLDTLKQGRFMAILYELPEEPSSRYRPVKCTWWQRVTTDAPRTVHVLSDLERLQKFTMLDWPPPDEVAFSYGPGNAVVAFYEIPYVWPEAGIEEADVLRVEFVFLPREEGWVFFQLLLVGEGIPYST